MLLVDMAEVPSSPPAEILLSKRVQEMVLNDEEPPAPYICRENEDPLADESPVPVIDMSHLALSEEESKETLEKIRAALSSWGCFQAIGHGISSCFLEEVQRVTREFFALPMEEKNIYAKPVHDFQGYGADPVPEEGQSLDWSDRLFLDVFPEDQRNYNFWPKKPDSFRDVLIEYMEKMKEVTEVSSKAMAKSLNLDEKCFLEKFGERPQLQARFNYYSPCKSPERVLGLKPHADGSGYTIIMQDEGGLQIHKDGKWFNVPKNPHALIVLVADQMQIMSNGIFKSPVHRVLSNSKRDRMSVAVFYTPEVGKEIEPEHGLVNEENPKLFKKVKDYANTHWIYYQKGLRALHTALV